MAESPPPTNPGPEDAEAAKMRRAGEVFFALRSLDAAEREPLIGAECSHDPEIERLVRLLLKGDEAPMPIERLADDIRAVHEHSGFAGTAAAEGTVIDRFRLLERLGEGGFGIVFAAEQLQPVRRRVALKIIKLGMDTRQVVARFEQERQALALMDHPCIAKVLDAGTTQTGRPYFVMELVQGLPITEYCDEHKLPIRDRLLLLAQVCEALHHAHQKGVIHRDVKPSNVLVTEVGGRPMPKIIDFGVAKATSARLTERTIFTEARQLLGTPEYMSPEQAGQSSEDVDTRTDVYAAGVLLYELLTGVTPFDSKRLRSAAFGEMQRIIREEEPPKPSTRVAEQRAILESVAARRSMPPARLPSTIRGELDWIVMKAMEKDRTRRYESAGEMSADIKRHLAGGALSAAPPSRAYLVRKFVRRNRESVIGASLLACALIAGLAGTSFGLFRARIQQEHAVSEKDRAERERTRADEKAAQAQAAESEALRRLYAASMSAASDAVASDHPGEARLALDEAPQGLRGWEWRHLNSRLDQTIAYHRGGLEGPVEQNSGNYDLLPSPDSASYFVMSSFHQKGLSRFDVRTGRETGPIPIPGWDTRASRLFFTPENDRIVLGARDTGDRENELRFAVWDVRTLAPATIERRDLRDPVRSQSRSALVAFSRDLSRAFVINTDRMTLLSLPDGTEIASRKGAEATRSTFDPTGRWVMYTDVRGRLTLLDARTLADHGVLPGHSNLLYSPKADSFSPDGSLLATAGGDGVVRIWNLSADPPVEQLELKHRQRCWTACITPDGRHVVTAAANRTVTVWDAATGDRVSTYMQAGVVSNTLAVFPDSRTVGAVCEDKSVAIWEIGAERTRVLPHQGTVYPAMFLPNQGLIATGGWDGFMGKPGSLRFWDADSGTLVAETMESGRSVVAGAVSRDGSLMAVGIAATNDAGAPIAGCGFEIRETATGRLLWADLETGQVPKGAAFDPSGRRLAFCLENFIFMYAARTGVQADRTYLKMQLTSMAWSSDGKHIAIASEDEFDGPRGKRIALIKPDGLGIDRTISTPKPNTVAFSPDSRWIAAGCADGRVRLWNTESGDAVRTLGSEDTQCFAVAFSPDGTRLAAAGEDKIIRIWDTGTFDLVGRLAGHESFVWSLAWDGAGERLISTSGDGTARVWETTPLRRRVQERNDRLSTLPDVERMVGKWCDEHNDAEKVIERISADGSLTAAQRKIALQVVLRRGLGSSAPKPD
ncbi:MAG: protein kinase [Planctomycetes bacterium]|nr:protein kinase [Planctomycetota bacterium]